MSRFSKPPTNASEQIALLKKRGLIIQNDDRAVRYLEVVSFFRLSAYMRPFQMPDDASHRFRSGVGFSKIVALYSFDREFRLIIMDAIERLEVAVRAMINHVMAVKYQDSEKTYSGSHWYLRPVLFNDRYDHARLMNTLRAKISDERGKLKEEVDKIERSGQSADKKLQLINLKQRENYFRYYACQYSEPVLPPCWAVIEELSLGELSHLYKGLRHDSDRKAIAARFQVPQDKLSSWLHTLTFVRNCCAHHARLWNRELPIAPKIMREPEWQFPKVIPNSNIQPAKRLFAVVLLLSHLMNQVSPDSQWLNRVFTLLNKYPDVPLKNMGFPENWADYFYLQNS